MYKTKTAWKVVSDPYAPESLWVPACADVDDGYSRPGLFQDFLKQQEKTTGRKIAEAVLLSSAIALLGGAFAGQSVHVNYYAQHLFGQFFYSDVAFEPWGPFYYWYNQANARCTYVPLFFSYSMGFLSSVNNLGKNFRVLSAGIVALYLVTLCVDCPTFPFVQEQNSYFVHLLASGLWGSVAAFFLGKTIARNVAAVISPRLIYAVMTCMLLPMGLSFSDSIMSNFGLVAATFALMLVALGFVIRCLHSGSMKTSILLSITAASPLVLCGLVHLPMASWFGNVLLQTYGFGAAFSRDLFYYMCLPGLALGLPVLGTLVGQLVQDFARHGECHLPPQITAEEETMPILVGQPIKESSQ